MTNLLAKLVVVLATNWVTVSRTMPVVPLEQWWNAIYISATLNQVGTITTNYLAEVVWKGKTNQVLLESVPVAGQAPLNRSIAEAGQSIYQDL